jgi:hypothetical protein
VPDPLSGHAKRSGASGQPSVPLRILVQMFGVGSFVQVVQLSLSSTRVASAASHVGLATYCV